MKKYDKIENQMPTALRPCGFPAFDGRCQAAYIPLATAKLTLSLLIPNPSPKYFPTISKEVRPIGPPGVVNITSALRASNAARDHAIPMRGPLGSRNAAVIAVKLFSAPLGHLVLFGPRKEYSMQWKLAKDSCFCSGE